MLDSLFSVLTTIGDMISSLGSFLLQLVGGLAEFVTSLLKAPAVFADLLSSGIVPSSVTAAIFACVTTVIIIRVIGRD